MRKLSDKQILLISTRDLERNTIKFVMVGDEKNSELEVRLNKINFLDKIQLHRNSGYVLYSNLLKATLRITKVQSIIDKLENQLR